MEKCPQFTESLKKHYLGRITAPNRFTQSALEAQLAQENMWDRNYSIKENIEREVHRATVGNVKKFLDNMIQLENDNQKVLLISEPLYHA